MGPDDAAELQYDGTAEMEYVRVVEYVPTGGCSLSEVSRRSASSQSCLAAAKHDHPVDLRTSHMVTPSLGQPEHF